MADYVTEAVNLFLERLDTVIEQLTRIADALEEEERG
jgi:hypothetical protein